MKKLLFVIALLAVLMPAGIKAQSYFEDTVWTKKTDQIDGFYMVKFSKTDSIIVGHGYEMAIFYDAFTGDEMYRLPFNAEVHFIENDNKFIQLAPSRDRLVIYDTKTYLPLDTLEYDGIKIGSVTISKDGKYIFGAIEGGVRLWDLQTGLILKTHIIYKEQNETLEEIYRPAILNDNSRAIISVYKEYYVNNVKNVRRYYPVFNLLTLDSIDTWEFYNKGATWFELSETNKYFAIKTGDPNNGVEIFDFATKQLLRRLPVNGPSLTGIEFSPDDKYIVTSVGNEHRSLKIWEIETGKGIYEFNDGGYNNIDISHNGKYIISSIGKHLLLYPFKTSSFINKNIEEIKYLYPNPTTDYIEIDAKSFVILKERQRLKTAEGSGEANPFLSVKVYDVLGSVVLSSPACSAGTPSEGGHIRLDVSDLAAGVYFVRVGGKMYKFMKM